ncbi:GNAT family N-acetyltransferase [bacterium]|nr:GNAT family N-acetyltransferase [bacterium]
MDRLFFPFELLTERLAIRSPSVGDASQLLEAVAESIDMLRPWMPWADHAPNLPEMEKNCREAEEAFREGTNHRFHLFLRDSGTFVGGSGLHRISWAVPKVEIGYWVRKSCGGKGYITEAVQEITRYALDELQAKRVEIRTSSRNVRSRRVPERLGFALEGTLRNDERHVDGTLCDTCIYARIAEGWSEKGPDEG